MGVPVVAGASLLCTMGMAPGSLMVTSQQKVTYGGKPAATIQDATPGNIMPCGMCTSLANPTVASATAAALGVLTPMPCTPMPAGAWMPGEPKEPICGIPTLTSDSRLQCSYGGSISITFHGQTKVL